MALNTVNIRKDEILYFGYGSNLWKAQMLKRCPNSTYRGIARLNGFRWIINDRGYANVVQILSESSEGKEEPEVVWGLVYSLTGSDEQNLDINEGVPYAYTKEDLTVDFWPSQRDGTDGADSAPPRPTTEQPRQAEMLVYIDRLRTEPDEPKAEYVWRMNRGIEDAVGEGMPGIYVRGVLRRFIAEEGQGEEGEEVERLARRQAERFEDEDC